MPKLARRPPVVIQTSALDCGPASLSALLRGIKAPGNYEALRDVCATDVDGTSIDALEEVAVGCGTDAEQLVLPAEHLLVMPEQYHPALVVIVLADGFPHFVLLWRRAGRRVLVMDPAIGLRWLPRRTFLDALYRHSTEVPAEDWREWAGSPVFTEALDRRLAGLGVGSHARSELLAQALDDPSPRGLAVLNATIRRAERDPAARAQLNRATLQAEPWLDDPSFSCTPIDERTVGLHGAVALRASHFDPAAADPDLLRALAVEQPSPARLVARLIRPIRWAAPFLLAGLAMGLLMVLRNIALRPLVQQQRALHAWQVGVILATAVAGCGAYGLAYLAGRQLDGRIRAAWWRLVGALPDSFTRSRPASDLIERGHLLHRVRELPVYLMRSALSLGVILASCLVMCWTAPAASPYVLLLVAVTVGVPALTFRKVAEADFQTRTLSGTLARFSYDSLLGAEAVLATGAGPAIAHEQEAILRSWWRAQRRFINLTAIIRIGTGLVSGCLAAAAVTRAHGGAAGGLLIAVLAVSAVDAGSVISDMLRALAEARSSVARAAGPLGARQVPPGGPVAGPAELRIEKVSVVLGAVTVLRDLSLTIPARAKVAVVGASGSGKSSLAALLMGWLEPSEGSVLFGGDEYDSAGLRALVGWVAPETRLWNDNLASNVEYGAAADAEPVSMRLERAAAGDLAQRLRDRPDARLGNAGSALSDGEAQRVRLARALGRPTAPLVVLDEPFGGLERPRRQRLLDQVRTVWAESTVLCITHDLGETAAFDLVVVLADGTIAEAGTPAELAADPDSYFTRLMAAEAADGLANYQHLHLSADQS